MSDPRPSRESTRNWSNAQITLVVIVILAVFAVSGGVYLFMTGAFTDEPNTTFETPPAATPTPATPTPAPPTPANPPGYRAIAGCGCSAALA